VQLQQEFVELKPYGRCSEKFLSKSRKYFGGNQRNVEKPQDVLKSVASMQDDNAKLKKTN
jgi:hypothetical protein